MFDQSAVRRAQCAGVLFCALLTALCALSCHRETRSLIPTAAESHTYEGNAYAISRGQQLFEQYNCSGCHAHGGGGIGPPLMDDQWIYGSSPAKIYQSISEGRPNGMPSWGGHIPDFQIWQLVTYVSSMSNLEPQNATPVRAEEMQAKKAEE